MHSSAFKDTFNLATLDRDDLELRWQGWLYRCRYRGSGKLGRVCSTVRQIGILSKAQDGIRGASRRFFMKGEGDLLYPVSWKF